MEFKSEFLNNSVLIYKNPIVANEKNTGGILRIPSEKEVSYT